MKNVRLLSLVVPAYKQEKTIVKDIQSLANVLSALPYRYEVIVVVDGFLDKTFEKAKSIKNNNIKVEGYKKNIGKGFAIRYGVEKAKGDVIGFIDAGMDIDPNSILTLVKYMQTHNADIVIGSKLHPDSNVKYPLVRKILSWGYRNVVHLLFGLNVRDTQAGLKLFKKEVAKEIFPRLTVNTFAFDIETLVIAKKIGFNNVREAPVKVSFRRGTITNLNFFKIALIMLLDTARVWVQLNIFNSYGKKK
ncbi:MAG: glycosyltransferase [Candidatus Levyibacteriota bacterium]|jgi:glycosyltransferase involved in cell wall biosynthesis